MMIFLLPVLVLLGCSAPQDTAITIDDIEISLTEFDEAFAKSRFARQGAKGRRLFLDEFISKKLILKTAEDLGLDRDPAFLSDIQRFWEQGLIKRVTLAKQEELLESIQISEADMFKYYQDNQAAFNGRSYDTVRPEIRNLIYAQRNLASMRQWVESLESGRKISINHDLLGIDRK